MQFVAILFPISLALVGASCAPATPPGEEGVAAREQAAVIAPDTVTERAPVPTKAEAEQILEHLREGLSLRAAGDAFGADAAFDQAINISPHIRDWGHVIAAAAAAEAKDSAQVRKRLDLVRSGAALEWGWRVRTSVLRELGDLHAAHLHTLRAADELVSEPARAAAWSDIGSIRLEAGDSAGAVEAFRTAMEIDRSSPGGLSAGRAAINLRGLSPADRLLTGRTLLAHGGTTRGVPLLEQYLDAGAGSEAERREVRLEIGRALFRARDWQGAHRYFSQVAGSSAEAALLAARSQYRMGERGAGRAALLAVPRSFPGTTQAAEALFLVADLDHDAGNVASARELYRQAVATGAEHAAATDAAVRLAGIAILAGDADAARADLEAFLADRPRDRHSAPVIYWLGRAHLLAGDSARARAAFEETLRLDPFSYYGGLAAERLGGSISEIPLGDAPPVDPTLAGQVDAALFRMDILRALEMNDAALFEMAILRARMADAPEALYAVAEGMIERGQPIQGALLGRELQRARGEWDERLLRIVFQYPYRDLVERESRRQGLDPFMVAGLIRQESFFNPVAESPVGAIGLMQVMPNTGRGLAAGAGIRNFQPSMLRDPEINVRLGTRFLASQIERWDGNPSDAFAAYNAGPTRVARWRGFPERRDMDIYVERIPIAETRDYVKKVRFHTHVYRRLYGG